MTKVITYGTFDLLHHGHVRLLQRAKELGDYLIVGVTADDFDKTRGKINVQQPLMERVEAVRKTGLADEIIIEEYEGQKIDDVKKYNIDIFTVGSDWVGKFDYLNEFCKVVYLDRTQGISSSDIRAQKSDIRMGVVGTSHVIEKFKKESEHVNGVEITAESEGDIASILDKVDAVYIVSHPSKHYELIKEALSAHKHVLCESPIAMTQSQCTELFQLAEKNGCVLMDAIKTAHAMAYHRLLLLVKSGIIGQVVSVDATCTSLKNIDKNSVANKWNSLCSWGPTAMLPIFQILGTEYVKKEMTSVFFDEEKTFDLFTKIDFSYENAVASLKVGKGVKSEGELVVSGTKGYIYVPAPWWKTDYFEVRFENVENNKRYFYQLDGEGIRYEIVAFIRKIAMKSINNDEDIKISKQIVKVVEDFNAKEGLKEIRFS